MIAIPAVNVVGAVISTTVCYMVCSLLNFRALIKATGVMPDFVGMLVMPAIASVVMGVFSLGCYHALYMAVPSNLVCTLVALVVAVAIYFVTMVMIKGFAREDLMMVPMGGKLVKFLGRIDKI